MTSTMTMTMATATGTSMSSMSTTTMMDMSKMNMTFFYSTVTALFSNTWTPKTTGQYAATCIFLIVLTMIHRTLLAFRGAIFAHTHLPHRTQGQDLDKGQSGTQPSGRQQYDIARELARGVVEAMSAGLGYLLMIAVMTMNVGYFSSVIAGFFLGGFLVGRFDGPLTC